MATAASMSCALIASKYARATFATCAFVGLRGLVVVSPSVAMVGQSLGSTPGPESVRKREVGRGERVLPGVWRLRLPLPWPGVPHCNAWAVASGHGVVLFDCGMHEPGSLAHLELAMSQVNLRLE